jgi:sulfur relay (sulfurtransferase) complex TusBCD TusD component (DsrE family)
VRLLFVVRTGPYAFQHLHTVHALARAALGKGHEVGIFLTEDAVVAMNANCKTGTELNLTQVLAELATQGVEIQGCGACCQFRGQKRADVAEGMKVAGIAALGKMIRDADRVVSFGY